MLRKGKVIIMAVTLQVQSVIYHNRKNSLLRALRSLANAIRVDRESAAVLGEVTVCYGDASASPVFSEEEIKDITETFSSFFAFRYVFFNQNTGSAKGHNLLGDMCTSDYMLIMNPDVLVCPRLFGNMLAPFFELGSKAGMVEARQTPIEHPKEYDRKTLETDWAATACAIFPTELFRELKGFDSDTFFLYCDDVDFSYRVRLAGKKVIYRPDCVVFHAKTLSATGNWQPTSAEVYYSQEAALMMAYKYSNMTRFKKLYKYFSESDETGKKVIQHFEDLKREGKLPEQLDPDHKVAHFVGDNYAESRFIL